MALLRALTAIPGTAASWLQGLSDLVIFDQGGQSWILAASRGRQVGLTLLRLEADGRAVIVDELGMDNIASTLTGPARLGLLPTFGGNLMVLTGGTRRWQARGVLMDEAGTLPDGQRNIGGDFPFELRDVAAAVIGGQHMVWGLVPGSDRPQAWQLSRDHVLVQAPAAGPAPVVPRGDDLIHVHVMGDRAILITASSLGHTISSWQAWPGAAPTHVQTLTPAQGFGISAPSAIAGLDLAGSSWAVVAGAGSSSLTVLRIGPDGVLTPVFHGIDSLHTRFAHAGGLAVLEAAGRGYVLAGGSEGGLSLFLLTPSGRLIHLESIVLAGSEGAPGNVTAITGRVAGGGDQPVRLDFLVAGEAPGLLPVAVDLGWLTAPRDLGAGGGVLQGGAGSDLLIGGAGASTLRGAESDDILIAGSGAVVMTGGAGRDLFVMAPNMAWNRINDFRPGVDRIDLSAFPMLRDIAALDFVPTASGARLHWQGTTIEIEAGRPLVPADLGPDPLGGLFSIGVAGDGGNVPKDDPLPQMQGVVLPGNEAMWNFGLSTAAREIPETGFDFVGDATLMGSDGPDRLRGTPRSELVMAGHGRDTIWTDAGDDLIYARSGANEIWAGRGNDTVIGGTGNDTAGGGPGNDLIDMRAGGTNDAWGGEGNDTVLGGPAGDRLGGGPGNDQIHGVGGRDIIWGAAWDDIIFGGDGNDTIWAGPGNDLVHGGAGNDRIAAGRGNDRVIGGPGGDVFEFYSRNDLTRIEDFSMSEGDRIALWSQMLGGIDQPAQVVSQHMRLTHSGHVLLDLSQAGTMVLFLGVHDLSGFAGHIDIF